MDFLIVGIGLAKAVLILYSLVSVAGIVERVLVLRRTGRAEEASFTKLRALAAKSDVQGALDASRTSDAPSSKALLAGLTQPGIPLRESVGREVTIQTAALQKNLPYLATIASTAPLRRVVRHGAWNPRCVPEDRGDRSDRARSRLGQHLRSAHHDRTRSRSRHSRRPSPTISSSPGSTCSA